MTETGVPVAAAGKPASSEINRIAAGAAVGAALLAAIEILVGSGLDGLGELVIVVVLVGLTTMGVFFWAVPWAMSLEEPGASVVGLVASVLGLLTVVIFWSGLTPVLAAAGVVLGWSEREIWESRNYSRAAIAIGVAALVLDVLVYFVALVT